MSLGGKQARRDLTELVTPCCLGRRNIKDLYIKDLYIKDLYIRQSSASAA
jgi:hypothetical protein